MKALNIGSTPALMIGEAFLEFSDFRTSMFSHGRVKA